MKKTISIILTFALMFSTLGALTACGGGSDKNTFQMFLYQGNSKYDTAFEKNAFEQYLESQEWEGSKISLDILVPPRSSSPTETYQTLVAAGTLPDIIDHNVCFDTLQTMYEDGIILDITDYVNEHMPNYKAYLEANPDIAPAAMKEYNGEMRYFSLVEFDDEAPASPWTYMYRRDWIVKYGVQPAEIMVDSAAPWKGKTANPKAGEKFSGGYNSEKEWSDDVIFPNGTNVPMYISDWEWMLDIFKTAITDLGLDSDPDSYPLGLYYASTDTLGGLTGAFNANPVWMTTVEGGGVYGATDESMRVYLDAMKQWYDKGYIDPAYYERASEIAYSINTAGYSSGKVGMWYGGLGLLADEGFDTSNPMVADAYSMGARAPLNDIYGVGTVSCFSEDNQFKNVFTYTNSRIGGQYVITTTAKDKNLPSLFTMLDWCYGEEGSIMAAYGLSAEQQAEMQNPLYIEQSIDAAWHYAKDENGNDILTENGEKMIERHEKLINDDNLINATGGGLLFSRGRSSLNYVERNEFDQISYDEMEVFLDEEYIYNLVTGLLGVDESTWCGDSYSYALDQAAQYFYRYIASARVKDGLDVNNDADWKVWTDVFDNVYKNGKTYNDVVKLVKVQLDEIIAKYYK